MAPIKPCNTTAECVLFVTREASCLCSLLCGHGSTLHLTPTRSAVQVAAYEFTTLTCIPGVVHYRGAKIQMLDLPGIIEGAKDGKGRGRQVKTPLAGPSRPHRGTHFS